MMTVEKYLQKQQLNKKLYHSRIMAILAVSLFLIIGVFWWLKLVGITMAGEAFCGLDEHIHDDQCTQIKLICSEEHSHTDSCYMESYSCGLYEHIHIASCYSDLQADLETSADWEATLTEVGYHSSVLENVVAVAKSQLGYTESSLNFKMDGEGNRHGYSRYGEWYGHPYGSWSTMFTAFCLRYAGVNSVPVSAGAETMRLKWMEKGFYQTPDVYTPLPGDIVFLDKNRNGTVDTTAILTEVGDTTITVIEGDLEGKVAQTIYSTDPAATLICGYGATRPAANVRLLRNTFALRAVAANGKEVIAKTADYDQSLFVETNCFVVYTQSGSNYYAFDGNGNSVPVTIDNEGNITSDVANPDTLLWTFSYSSANTYLIRNVSTGKYMHAYPNNGSGVTTGGAYPSTLIQSGSGVRIRSNSEYARLDLANSKFVMTQNQSLAAVYQFGVTSRCTVWLDGTNGGLMSLGGSQNQSYNLMGGDVITLPSEWKSPDKYAYKLQGWYDVKNSKYYLPGDEVTVTENMVFYADWVAETYDIGQFNSQTANTVSTNEFITTRVFDFGPLFNLLSTRANVNVSSAGHTETWQMVTGGKVPYQDRDTLNYIFVDYDGGGDITYPSNRDGANTSGGVYAGLYSDELAEILFGTDNIFNPATGEGIIGKTYVGEGDYLLQYSNDPNSEYYGYYYYNASLNAASYNQSEQRFYVYEYLERTRDSSKVSGNDKYSDFLPFNSPYANTNGKDFITYTYDGLNGEYAGVNHIQYDAKYNTDNNSTNYISTNYGFGMSMELNFYLSHVPGTRDSSGQYGNKDLYGNDMHFHFAGDDDLWVLLDGELILDLGGIHGSEDGDINFSTGVITVNGTQVGNLYDVAEGDHTLTIYYLERGSSQSNCEIRFNLAPRFSLNIQKEDVLTQDVLNGAQFSVYDDKECTIPSTLWVSKDSHDAGDPSTNVFTVVDGVAKMWGLGSGRTYYIRETRPPDAKEYSYANGIICLTLDKRGIASYTVEIIRETDEDGNIIDVSQGFTVHGFKIDEDTQEAFIIATNAKEWVKETTTVQAFKIWEDDKDHSGEAVTVYLTVTDPDGTVRRIREIVLSEENDWRYTWTNLPKYLADMVTPVQYGVEEAYHSGYYSTVTKVDELVSTTITWAEALTFKPGGVYLLKTANGCLATVSASDAKLRWLDEESAQTDPTALWTATVSGNNVKFTNGVGQTLSFNYGSNSSSRYFYATSGSATYQTLVPVSTTTGFRFYCTRSSRNYYISTTLNTSTGRLNTSTYQNSGLIFTPMTQVVETVTEKIDGWGYQLTNIPLEVETSVTVNKAWDLGMTGTEDLYIQAQVTIKLLANGKDTGRTVTLSLKNGWKDTFRGLPYTDEDGNVIVYTVEESWETEDWFPVYGEMITVNTGGGTPTYETTVTNTYRWGWGYELPSTGGLGQTPWLLGGAVILLSSASGFALRRKRERRDR